MQVSSGADIAMVGDPSRAHLPAPSYWPIIVSFGLPIIGYGLIFNLGLAVVGGLITFGGLIGWALEPPDDEDLPPHGHDGDDHGDHDGDAAAPSEDDAPPVAVGAGEEASDG
jgi:hypothetical protein